MKTLHFWELINSKKIFQSQIKKIFLSNREVHICTEVCINFLANKKCKPCKNHRIMNVVNGKACLLTIICTS